MELTGDIMKILVDKLINSSVHHDTAIFSPMPDYAQLEKNSEMC